VAEARLDDESVALAERLEEEVDGGRRFGSREARILCADTSANVAPVPSSLAIGRSTSP